MVNGNNAVQSQNTFSPPFHPTLAPYSQIAKWLALKHAKVPSSDFTPFLSLKLKYQWQELWKGQNNMLKPVY